jgi:hypothetical protein
MLLAKAFGLESALVTEPSQIGPALKTALKADVPYLLEFRTRGDVPMPRTGFWDIADFLAHGNESPAEAARAGDEAEAPVDYLKF